MSLLSKLKSPKKTAKEMRIVVLGLDNAGKTTILESFSNEPLQNIAPTKSFNIKGLVCFFHNIRSMMVSESTFGTLVVIKHFVLTGKIMCNSAMDS